MKYILISFSFFIFFPFLKLKATVVPEGSEFLLNSRYDNGYKEDRFERVTKSFEAYWRPHFEAMGASFYLDTDWGDGAVNAWAWKEGTRYSLEIPGGLSRFHTMSEEAFVMILCHELGHLMGGIPARSSQISYEGQSDYFAALKCFPRFYEVMKKDFGGFESGSNRTVFVSEKDFPNKCSNHSNPELCEHSLLGALGPTAYYAELEKSKTPSLSTPDSTIARRTQDSHPKAQCRFDTMVAATFCPADPFELPSWSDVSVGQCHQGFWPEFARPACWYKP